MSEAKDTLRLFRDLLLSYKLRSFIVLVCLLVGGLAEGVGIATLLPLLGLAFSGSSENTSFLGKKVESLIRALGLEPSIEILLLLVVVVMMIKAALVMLAARQVGYTAANVATDLRLGLIRNLMKAKWEYFINQPMGRLSNAIATEAERTSVAYVTICRILADAIQASVYTAVALFISWQVTLGGMAAGIVIITALRRLITVSRQAGAAQTDLLKSIAVRLTEGIQGIKMLKAMACEDRLAPMLERETKALNKAKQKQVISKEGLTALQEPILVVAVAIVIYFGVRLWSRSLDSLMILVLLFWRTVGRVGNLQREYQRVVSLESAYWSLRESIQEAAKASEEITGQVKPTFEHSISFDKVTFSYDASDVLSQASFSIPARRLTAFVGPSGVGKTTIADLTAGLLSPQSGDIRIDNTSLSKVDLLQWRKKIGYVPQEIFLFHDTIENNLTLGNPNVTRAETERALRLAGAWDFVAALPNGVDTILGEKGARISGGQRQRIAIARALMHHPDLLILDEVTTALDPKTEAEICQTLKMLTHKTTILAISHQHAIMESADVIYDVREGRVKRLDRVDDIPLTGRVQP